MEGRGDGDNQMYPQGPAHGEQIIGGLPSKVGKGSSVQTWGSSCSDGQCIDVVPGNEEAGTVYRMR